MASASIDRLVAIFDRREHRTLPPVSPDHRGPSRDQITHALESLEQLNTLTKSGSFGQTLFDSLALVAEGALWDPFALQPGRTRLFGELVLNLAQPRRINQGLKGTCAAACIEGYMAERNPAEYARIVAGLVTRDGRATLPSGDSLVCDEDVLDPNPFERNRNPVSRIFQAACMDFAYPNMDYDNVIDGYFDGDTNVGSGLEMNAFERLLQAVTSESWKTISLGHSKMSQLLAKAGMNTQHMPDILRDGLAIITQSTQLHGQVFVTLQLPELPNPLPDGIPPVLHNMPHKVRAFRVDQQEQTIHYDDPMDPRQRWFDGARVTIVDTFGHCSMPIDDFLRLMTEMSFQPQLWNRHG